MNNTNLTIAEIVAEDYRTAAIFSKFKIDFCCKGNRTIQEVCEKKNLDTSLIFKELHSIHKTEENINYNNWPIDLLVDYIIKIHHQYIREKTIPLLQFLYKVQKVHGPNFPELYEIHNLFVQSSENLITHITKEESVLFPFIKKMVITKNNNQTLENIHFGSVENPIQMMKEDHNTEGERFKKISKLTNNYDTPEWACNTFKVSYAMLKEFEENLHKHIHLENNILFPKAINLEAEVREK